MLDAEPPKQMTSGLSLILATLGRTDEIGRFFSSIEGSAGVLVEVIVVDQNSDDRLLGIVEAARRRGLFVNHIRVARKGLSFARNVGLREARYDLVGFPDDDCWYEPDTCEAIYAKFHSDKELDGLVVRWMDRHDEYTQPAKLDVLQQRKFSGIPIASICLFFRTQVLTDTGNFDELLGVGEWFGSSEETDLVLRVLDAGHRMSFAPEITVRHFWGGSAISISGNLTSIFSSARKRARGTGAIYAKHNLSLWVVVKGVLAPAIKTLLLRDGVGGIAYWAGTSLGRMQGLLAWKFRKA